MGESNYQRELGELAGGLSKEGRLTRDGVRLEFPALIVREPDNPHDANAIAVKIRDTTVGYLARDDAKKFATLLDNAGYNATPCKAVIVGGQRWHRENFGVWIDLRRPPKIA